MAVAFVTGQVNGSLTTASPSSATVSFPAATTVGNLVLVFFDWDGSTTLSSVTDNAAGGSNTYTQVGSQLDYVPTSSPGAHGRVYWAKAKATETLTITITLAGAAGSYIEIECIEFSGQHTTTPIDSSRIVGKDTTATTSDSITTVASNVLVCAWASLNHGTAANTTAGFTQRTNFDSNDLSDNTGNLFAAGSHTLTYSGGDGTTDWGLFLVGIQPPSSGVATSPPLSLLNLLGVGS